MKNFKKLSLVAGFATLMSFGAEAQVTGWTGDNPTTSNNPVGIGSPLPTIGGTYPNLIGYGLYVKTPTISLNDMSQVNSGLVIEGAGVKAEGFGASLGFALNSNPSTGYLAYQHGRIMVTPDKLASWSALGKMYLQTRGPVVNGQWTWNKNLVLDSDGSVAIGCETSPNYKLTVDGKMTCRGIKVQDPIGNTLWPDYVFKQDYKLRTLAEVEHFIAANNHLPDVPSELEVKTDGIELATMDAVLLRKVEELTLYMIQLQKDNLEMKAKLEALSK